MDMSLTGIHSSPSAIVQLLVFFCLLWPFVTPGLFHRGEHSSAPVLAMLLPLTLAMGLMWVGLANVIRVMAISGSDAATAAGIAEALVTPTAALFPIVLIAIFALMRRHRAALDHFSAAIAAGLLVELVAALLFSARIAPTQRNATLALVWAGSALVLAVLTTVRLVLVVRGRVALAPLRFGVTIATLSFAAAGVVLYQQVHRYMAIAIGRNPWL